MLRHDAFFWNLDRDTQNAEWANQLITRFRWDWRPVVEPTYYIKQKALLLSMQDLSTSVKRYFDDEEFLRNINFKPVPVMEKLRNILIDEIKKSGIKPYIKATDPSAKKEKDLDRFRLATRTKHERDINVNRRAVGIPDYKIDSKGFNGNIDDFDQMGMNEGDQSEVQFFFDNFYKLRYEADAQTIVSSFLKLNMVDDDIPRYANDIMAVKVVCKQDYISPMSGQIVIKYLQPSQTFAIFGKRRDALDAPVKGWEMQITVQELMSQLGNAFNFEADWLQLIQAINYGSNTTFDGFIRGNNYYNMNVLSTGVNDVPLENKAGTIVDLNFLRWEDVLNYKVYFGYIEFEQPYYHSEKINKKTGQMFTVPYSFKPTERSLYNKESWGAYTMKVSNYIATGTATQKLYGYGELFHQLTYGQYDEYASGSISIIREEGKSAVDIAEIYIDLANYAYYKMLWTIHRSKPDVWDFSYESIREVAMKMQPIQEGTNTPQTAGFDSALNNLIEMFQKKLVMLHTYPIVDGQVVGGGGTPHTKIPGALDALAMQIREFVLEWAENQITDKIGIGGLREANAPNPKDGLKLNEMYLKQSRAATGYIPDMIQRTFEHTAKITLLYCQDIIKHKSSIPYKFLLDFVGKDALASIEQLDNVAAHRLGIFVESLNVAQMREEMIQQAAIANQQGNLTFFEFLMIKGIEDPRKAGIIFAYYQEKMEKRKQQQLMQVEQMKQQTLQMQHGFVMDQINAKGQWDVSTEKERANGYIAAAQVQNQGKIDVTQLKEASKAPQLEQKTESQTKVLEAKHNLEESASLA